MVSALGKFEFVIFQRFRKRSWMVVALQNFGCAPIDALKISPFAKSALSSFLDCFAESMLSGGGWLLLLLLVLL